MEQTTSPAVFVSHKTENRDLADRVIEAIQEVGLDVWIAPEHIPPGAKWKPKIDEAIEESIAIVVILTKESLQSQWVTYEWVYALLLDKPIFPLKFEEAEIHEKLLEFQTLDFTQRKNREKELEKLQSELTKLRSGQSIPIPRNAPRIVQGSIRDLDDKDIEIRTSAIRNLAQNSHATALEALIAAAHNHLQLDVRVKSPIEIVKNHPDSAAQIISPLIESLQHADNVLGISKETDLVKMKLETILTQIGIDAVPYLITTWCDNENTAIGDRSQRILLNIGNPTIPTMIELLKNDINAYTRRRVIWFFERMLELEKVNVNVIIHALIAALNDSDAFIRYYASRILGDRKITDAIPYLIKMLTDSDIPNDDNLPVAYHVAMYLFQFDSVIADDAIIPFFVEELDNTAFIGKGNKYRRCDRSLKLLQRILQRKDRPDLRADLKRRGLPTELSD
ncbi:MAG: toll/interleukin-1 receptor domain-containing protein [Anaerolineaceae bacterium]|nr:toll/interleukin-1 receptor domain-containing protein [Anaerolineaceae bacterium]